MTAWNFTLLAVHIAAMYGFSLLVPRAPDRLQKAVVWILMIASYLMVFAYSLQIMGRPSENWRWIAQEVEHVGVLLYLFRIVYLEHILCKTSSPASPS